MKKIFFLLTSLVIITACAKKTHSVVGKWKPVEMNIEDMSEDEKQEVIKTSVLEFRSDGNFLNSSRGYKMEGRYVYNVKDSTLKATSKEDSKVQEFKITWDDDKMVMTNKEGAVKLKKE